MVNGRGPRVAACGPEQAAIESWIADYLATRRALTGRWARHLSSSCLRAVVFGQPSDGGRAARERVLCAVGSRIGQQVGRDDRALPLEPNAAASVWGGTTWYQSQESRVRRHGKKVFGVPCAYKEGSSAT